MNSTKKKLLSLAIGALFLFAMTSPALAKPSSDDLDRMYTAHANLTQLNKLQKRKLADVPEYWSNLRTLFDDLGEQTYEIDKLAYKAATYNKDRETHLETLGEKALESKRTVNRIRLVMAKLYTRAQNYHPYKVWSELNRMEGQLKCLTAELNLLSKEDLSSERELKKVFTSDEAYKATNSLQRLPNTVLLPMEVLSL